MPSKKRSRWTKALGSRNFLIPKGKVDSVRELIVRKSEPEPYSGCWIWAAGYFGHREHNQRRPALYFQGIQSRAALFSFEAFNGRSRGLFVLHTCDTPSCVNPKHLALGTIKDNSDHKMKRGRCRNSHTGPLTENIYARP